MKIVAHTLVKNEEKFIWYSINSIINHVDEILVWDTGSTDNTPEIIKFIKNPKIKFKEIGSASAQELSNLRKKMLEESNDADFIFILDGDEIWHEGVVRELINKLPNLKEDVVVCSNYMLIGDMFHYQEKSAGKYKIADKKGHYNIRVIRNLSNLSVSGVYPNEAYVDSNGVKVQNFSPERIFFFDKPYLHASFLNRSQNDKKKLKYEIGESFPKDFFYPEAFFRTRPTGIPIVWGIMSMGYRLRAFIETPIKKIKRRIA